MIDILPKNTIVLESVLLTTKVEEDTFSPFPIRKEVPESVALTIQKACLYNKGIFLLIEAPKDAQFKAFHCKTVKIIPGTWVRSDPAIEIFLCALGKKSQSTQLYPLLISETSLPNLKEYDWIMFRVQREVCRLENMSLGHTLSPTNCLGHGPSSTGQAKL